MLLLRIGILSFFFLELIHFVASLELRPRLGIFETKTHAVLLSKAGRHAEALATLDDLLNGDDVALALR